MPEIPDIVLYVNSLDRLLRGQTIESLIVRSPFVVRTVDPPIDAITGQRIKSFSRIGKRVCWHLSDDLHLVFHLMIAGRFHWSTKSRLPTGKNDLLAIRTKSGSMMLTEASSKKRAGLWIVRGENALRSFDMGGINIMECDFAAFHRQLISSNHTLKRAIADPHLFDGIGNAYGDEILHASKLSPLRRTQQLSEEEAHRLFESARNVLRMWIDRLASQNKDRFPEKVTAFRPEMAVHGKYREPCPECNAPIQRIRYAENECNYCPGCQTEGRILADRSLSRLLKDDWPKTLDDLEEMLDAKT